MKNLLLIIFLTFFQTLVSQNQKFEWYDETCTYLSLYDNNKYNKSAIENCFKIIYFNSYRITKTPSVHKPRDINRLNKDSLTYEYLTKLKTIKNLKLPNSGNWNKFRDSITSQLEQEYKFSMIAYKAYITKDFGVLNDFWKSDSLIDEYCNALQGSDTELLNTWKNLTSRKAEINCCPDKVWGKYRTKRDSENWKEYAQVDIMTFGWWNSANKYIKRFDGWRHYDEFDKLFISTKEIECDEI
jgi:hypothetical protein